MSEHTVIQRLVVASGDNVTLWPALHIPRRPMGKARARNDTTAIHSADTTALMERLIGNAMRRHMRTQFDDTPQPMIAKGRPIMLRVHAKFAPSRSAFEKYGSGIYGTFHTETPDASNILKLVEDALNGIAYEDDKQVVMPIVIKTWAPIDELVITIGEP